MFVYHEFKMVSHKRRCRSWVSHKTAAVRGCDRTDRLHGASRSYLTKILRGCLNRQTRSIPSR